MRNIFMVTCKDVSFGKVELWKVHDYWQVRRKGTFVETTSGYREFEKAVEFYNSFK